MTVQFTPPPTYAAVILYDENAPDIKVLLRSVRFNPIWLKWFIDVAQFITSSGGGGGGGTDHQALTGLQGGGATERYHLTAAQQTALIAGFTGTGNLVRQTSPALTTPNIGTPSAGTLTNCVGLPVSAGTTCTATNNNASAGQLGEFVESAVTAVTINVASSGNMTSISLTAGDWDVTATFQNSNIGTNSYYSIGISTTSATFAGAPNAKETLQQSVNTAISVTSACIPRLRMSLSGTTTVYFVAQMGVADNSNCDGYMTARRVR